MRRPNSVSRRSACVHTSLVTHNTHEHVLDCRKPQKTMISRFWSHFAGWKKCKTRISDGLLRPMAVILTQDVSSMYGEDPCQRILKNKNFFTSKTFLEFAGTTQKWVKHRPPKCWKKSSNPSKSMISRFWGHFAGLKKCKTRISDGLLRPMTVISTQELSSMYREASCQRS